MVSMAYSLGKVEKFLVLKCLTVAVLVLVVVHLVTEKQVTT
jgi:hypothetical protein